nr:hypothetical protein [Micromonospora sp. DSM 115978]
MTTYGARDRAEVRSMRLAGRLRGLVALPPVRRAVDALVARSVHGPSEEFRAVGRSWFFVQAERDGDDGALDVTTGTFGGPEAYLLTARLAVAAVVRVLDGTVSGCGVLTPSQAFGAGFVASIEGCAVVVRPGSEPVWADPTSARLPSA